MFIEGYLDRTETKEDPFVLFASNGNITGIYDELAEEFHFQVNQISGILNLSKQKPKAMIKDQNITIYMNYFQRIIDLRYKEKEEEQRLWIDTSKGLDICHERIYPNQKKNVLTYIKLDPETKQTYFQFHKVPPYVKTINNLTEIQEEITNNEEEFFKLLTKCKQKIDDEYDSLYDILANMCYQEKPAAIEWLQVTPKTKTLQKAKKKNR